MNDQIKTFEQVLNKYHLTTPVNPDIQEFIVKSRKKNLNLVLKRVGQFGILYWMVILTNMFFKKFGINLSIIQSKIIFGVTTVVVTTTSSTGVYYTGKYIYHTYIKTKQKPIELLLPHDEIDLEIPKMIHTDKKHGAIEIKTFKFGIKSFSSDVENTDNMITQKIFNEIKKLEGNKSITMSEESKDTKLLNIITGSYRKMGNSYQLTAKVIDAKNYKVKVLLSEKISNSNEIDNACKKIAREISKSR